MAVIAYGNSAPKLEEIMCLYLYNKPTAPGWGSLKTWEDVLKLKTEKRDVVQINKRWFMEKGGGRFMRPEYFGIVRRFLKGEKGEVFKPENDGGTRVFTPAQVFEVFGVPDGTDRIYGFKQYGYGLGDPDFSDRAEVFGSSGFKLNKDAKFIATSVLGEDEKYTIKREIQNIWIEPDKDNYDYESADWRAMISNFIMEDLHGIDPMNLGKSVPIEFVGAALDAVSFTDDPEKIKDMEKANSKFEEQESSKGKQRDTFLELHPKKMIRLWKYGALYAKHNPFWYALRALPGNNKRGADLLTPRFFPRDAE